MLEIITSSVYQVFLNVLPIAFAIYCILQITTNYREESFYSKFCLLTLSIGLISSLYLFVMQFFNLVDLDQYKFKLFLLPSIKNDLITFIGLVIAILSYMLCLVTAIFSKQYLHKEQGFAKFYSLIILFCYGMVVASNSQHFSAVYVGWEIVGLTSFLLISFFYEREKSVHRALRILAWYKLADFFLLIAVACSVAGELNPEFHTYAEFCFINAILIKSAQVPCNYWLPWALEGPSPSSAVFYGGLGIHLGVIGLLSYTSNNVLNNLSIIMLVTSAVLSIVTCRIAQRSQSDAKSIIVYGVICQISIIILEIVAGFHNLALAHIFGHALFRTFQILTVGGIIHDHPATTWSQLFKVANLENLNFINNYLVRNRLYYESSKEIQYVHYPLIIFEAISSYIHKRSRKLPATFISAFNLVGIILILLLVIFTYKFTSHVAVSLWAINLLVLSLIAFSFYFIFAEAGIKNLAKSLILFHLALVVIELSNNQHLHSENFLIYALLTILLSFVGLLLVKSCLQKRFGKNFSAIHSGLYSVCPQAGLCAFICLLSLSGFPGTIGALSSEFVIEHLMQTKIFLILVPFSFTILTWCGYRRFADSFYGRATVANKELFALSIYEKFLLNSVSASIIFLATYESF